MNLGKKLTDLRETESIPGESLYPVEMGDGTGTKHVKHKTLVGQIRKELELSYEETMALLLEEETPGETEGRGNGNQNSVKSEGM